MDEERRTIRVELFDGDSGDDDWPPEDPDGFMAWWQAKLAAIPEDARGTARVELDGGSYDRDTFAKATIYYDRDETAEETAARLARERAENERRLARTRQELERLEVQRRGLERLEAKLSALDEKPREVVS